MEDDLDPLLNGLSGPLGDVIAQVGEGLAAAQQALDLQAVENLRALAVGESPADQSLRDIGYRPTFYHIPECTVEMKVALADRPRGAGSGWVGTPGDGRIEAHADGTFEIQGLCTGAGDARLLGTILAGAIAAEGVHRGRILFLGGAERGGARRLERPGTAPHLGLSGQGRVLIG